MEQPRDSRIPKAVGDEFDELVELMQSRDVIAGVDKAFRADPSEYATIIDASKETTTET